MWGDFGWSPYVPVAERRRKALKKMDSLRKKGRTTSPVSIDGRTIAKTFWGRAWCDNLESYSDYENRLPRGRAYVRNGSVLDLQVAPGRVKALVSGSEIYEIEVKILPVAKTCWKSICEDCAGSIDSLVELLQGRLSKGVMERICQQQTGLFPSPQEIKLSCSCPDWAEMCKHVAAVLHGVGARLDRQPELLFRLREVDEKELIANAGKVIPSAKKSPSAAKVLGRKDLSELFGLDLAESTSPARAAQATKATATKAKPAASKARLPQKAANAMAKAKPASHTKVGLKKKPAPASAKTKPAERPARKKPAASSTKESGKTGRKSAIRATRKNAAAAIKTKATKAAVANGPAVKRASQKKSTSAPRRISEKRAAKVKS